MTETLLNLSSVATDLRLDGHLVECSWTEKPWRECQWCHWAVSAPQIRLLLDSRHDARSLLHSDAHGTVPWVTAAGELLRVTDGIDLHAILVPSVRGLAERLHRVVVADLDRLRARLRTAVAKRGPVEQRCLQTAGPLAAAAIQQPEHAAVLDQLPPAARSTLADVAASLSTGVQVAGLLPVVEQLHWRPLHALRTQPEWNRRPLQTGTAGTAPQQPGGPQVAPGSLEALVVESVIDRVATDLVGIGDDLVDAAPPVTLTRSAHQGAHSARTRARLWRIARIDWHLTFVDTGWADCWNARVEGERIVTDVPWTVALAIDVTEPHGLISATHQDRPAVSATSE